AGGSAGYVDIAGEWIFEENLDRRMAVKGTVSVGTIVARGGDGAVGGGPEVQRSGRGGDGGVVWIGARDGVSVPGGIDTRGGDAAIDSRERGGHGGDVLIGGDFTFDNVESLATRGPVYGVIVVGDILTRGGRSGEDGAYG